jgi:hypothetical protein
MDGLLVLLGLLYLVPAAVAQLRRHHQTTAIVGLNLLLGWTFIGWAVALVWALTATPPAGLAPTTPAVVPAALRTDPGWLDTARGWALILAGLLMLGLLLVGVASAEAATCTTRDDRDFGIYRTRCTDGREYTTRYDRDVRTWRTREALTSKPRSRADQPRR